MASVVPPSEPLPRATPLDSRIPRGEVELPVLEVQPWVHRLRHAVADATWGVLRVDLTRPTWRRVPGAARPGRGVANPPRGAAGYVESEHHWEYSEQATSSVVQGARIKGLRYVGFGPLVPSGRHAVDFGLGLDLDMERGNLRPTMRLRIMDVVRVKLLPQPIFKLKHDFPILDTGMVARITFHQPLSSADLRQLGKSGAWNVSFGRKQENGVRFSPDRLEITGQHVALGNNLKVWFSGDVTYPRNLPSSDWQDQIRFSPARIGLKVGW